MLLLQQVCVQPCAGAGSKVLCVIGTELFLGLQQLYFRAGGQLGPGNTHSLCFKLCRQLTTCKGVLMDLVVDPRSSRATLSAVVDQHASTVGGC